VQVHSDVDHDRASFLSFVLSGRYDVHVVNTGAEARSFMASSSSLDASTRPSLTDTLSPVLAITGTHPEGGAMSSTRKLYRSRTNRKLAGVCGGLAQYFNTDATLIRVLFVVLALLGGPGLVIYLVLWIVVPEEPLGAA
jgi:phage shock protein PspC (stress-responsive transcriptional regulator)